MPNSRMPVAKAPIRKYFRAASLERKFRLSLPVSTYIATDRISSPRNSMMRFSKPIIMKVPTSEKSIMA